MVTHKWWLEIVTEKPQLSTRRGEPQSLCFRWIFRLAQHWAIQWSKHHGQSRLKMFNYFTLITLLLSKLASRKWKLPNMFYFKIFYSLAKLYIVLDLINVFSNFLRFSIQHTPICVHTYRTDFLHGETAFWVLWEDMPCQIF